MVGTSFKRVIRNAFTNFWRNGWVSVATILVMVLAILMVGSLIMFQVLLNATLAEVEKKVDVSAYFKQDAEENEIFRIRGLLQGLSEVREITYVSQDEALAIFKERHKDNALISSALDELGENPLGAVLRIRAAEQQNYESIVRFLENGGFDASLDKVDYRQNEAIFRRLEAVLALTRRVGFGVSAVLGFVAFLVAFNTIRLAIYTSREEISIMRLVGASTWYVRGPFLVEGAAHGFFASIISMLIFWPATLWMGPRAREFFGGVDLFSFYTQNLFLFFFALFMVGITIGVFSSFVATRRYLKI
ncbi:MAG: permease-like cell division protein FtsX [Patescibacteria group bacterium]